MGKRPSPSVRGRSVAAAGIGPDFGGHEAFGAVAITNQDYLPGAKFGEPITPQRFHVHEDIGCALAAGEEAKATQPVEPFHPRTLQPARGRHAHMRARRKLRRMHRRGLVMEMIRKACMPFARCNASTTMRAP